MNSLIIDGGDEHAWAEEEKTKTLREEKCVIHFKKQILDERIERMAFPSDDKPRTHRIVITELDDIVG